MMSTTSDMRILWLWVILVLDLTLAVAAQSENARRDSKYILNKNTFGLSLSLNYFIEMLLQAAITNY